MATMHRGSPVSHLNEFVGRESELAELRTIVPARRLVTITGQAGIGKSRTAERLAEMLRRSFGGAIVSVDMGGRDSARIDGALAEALGSPEAPIDEIARTLGDRPHLIVVDDLRHAGRAAAILESLLRQTSETRLLVTSRELLGIRGETPYVLAPLATPSAGDPRDDTGGGLESPAGDLLLRLVRDIDSTFEVSAPVREDLCTVCAATDGVPRFIEAAARAVYVLGARATAIAVAEDPTMLDSFVLPGAEPSRAVLEESLGHVSPPARRLLERLSLFEAGCDLRFAADLFADGSVARIAAPVSELVEHSIVRAESVGEERRLRVPLHYRAHALASWDERERAAQQRRLRRELLTRMRHCAASWFSEDQLSSIQFLNRHAADVTALLGSMSAEPDNAHEALEVISSLRYYWQLHPIDPWPRVRDWLGTALAVDTVRDAVTLRALQSDAYIAFHEGDLHGARAQLLASRSLELDSSEPGLAEALFGVFVEALIELAEGDAAAAGRSLARVLRESLQADVREHVGEKYWYVATCQVATGHEDEALTTLADGLEHCERVGDVWGRAYMWWLEALIADRRGHGAEAVARVREAIEVMSDFGDRRGLAFCVRLLAAISSHNGEGTSAARLAGLVPRPTYTGPPVPLPELTHAHSLAAGPPMPLPDRSLGEVLDRIMDKDAPAAAPRRAETSDALSRREWEIAALVAEGLGNPAIAARLVLSRRTVEGHVQRILAKLGFRSRSQIAVWVARRAAPTAITDGSGAASRLAPR